MAATGITALVASRNEAHLLKTSLGSLSFCDEVILVNLESTDDTAKVAREQMVTYIEHAWVPVVEMLHAEIIPTLPSDWIIILDPDEEIEATLAKELVSIAKDPKSQKMGVVYVPFQFYFKRKKLKGGVWGGIKTKRLMLRKRGIVLSPNVHAGTSLKSGYVDHYIPFKNNNLVHHYWMDSYTQLFEKHRRYIQKEGKARYEQGHRFRYIQLLKTPLASFHEAYFTKRGYRDGITGIFLGLFWAWYNYQSRISLKQYQKEQEEYSDHA